MYYKYCFSLFHKLNLKSHDMDILRLFNYKLIFYRDSSLFHKIRKFMLKIFSKLLF